MGYLNGKTCYLSGAMENCNLNYNWRTEPIKILKERFGLEVFDPYSDPKQQWVKELKAARESKDYKTISKIAHAFVRKDLCLVDRCDILIAHVIPSVPSVGTVHEIINSNNAKKPTLLVNPISGKENIQSWYYGFIDYQNGMFGSWDDLYDYLDQANKGMHQDNNRWDYIYGKI